MNLRDPERFHALHPWLTACLVRSMSIAFKVNRRSGDYIMATVVPSRRGNAAHFGFFDSAIVVTFLAAASGLIYLLAR